MNIHQSEAEARKAAAKARKAELKRQTDVKNAVNGAANDPYHRGGSVEPEGDRLLRFCDLVARGIVRNWVTLAKWIEREGFPPGLKLGPNSRAWTLASVQEWIASRPPSRIISC